MSVIIALKNKEGVILGADKQSTRGDSALNTTKIKQMEYSKIGIGTAGYTRDGNILCCTEEIINYGDIIKKIDIDFRYVVNNIVPTLFNIFRANKRIILNEGIEYFKSEFLLVTNDKIFNIFGDGAVLEDDTYGVIGCGEDNIYGYLDTIPNIESLTMKESEKIIEKAIRLACKKDIYINDNIDIIKLYKEK